MIGWFGVGKLVDAYRETLSFVRELRASKIETLEAELAAERARSSAAVQRALSAERDRDISTHFSKIDRRGQ